MAPLSIKALLTTLAIITTASSGPTLKPHTDSNNSITIPTVSAAGSPILESFVSYSIELAFFPDFAGNTSHPNTFSANLLSNLGALQGSKPHIRVGGNTQDYALFNASLQTATYGIYTNVSADYPRILSIGPSFFESYQTWDGVRFIHGFNLAKNGSAAMSSLVDSVPYACKALSHNNFAFWEMGNEPDLYKTSAQGVMRPAGWNETGYVAEWNEKVAAVKDALRKSCGEQWVNGSMWRWIAPSFAGTTNGLNAVKSWNAGLDEHQEIARFSSHNYIGGATQPGITLANTLLNHTKTALSISAHTAEHANLTAAGMNLPYILGETNSLYNQGAPGLSNSFGAALWGLDFNLLCAATVIRQVFMHMGTDYRYASWQPVQTNKTAIGTKPPYYGNVAVAAALGDAASDKVQVANIPLGKETEAAYAIFANETLKRLVVVNMAQYNYSGVETTVRPESSYAFSLPTSCEGMGVVQRLIANGSDAVTGVSFNGVTFNYEVDGGRPKVLGNVTRDEMVEVGADGGLSVGVPASSAVVVQLKC